MLWLMLRLRVLYCIVLPETHNILVQLHCFHTFIVSMRIRGSESIGTLLVFVSPETSWQETLRLKVCLPYQGLCLWTRVRAWLPHPRLHRLALSCSPCMGPQTEFLDSQLHVNCVAREREKKVKCCFCQLDACARPPAALHHFSEN